MLQIVTKRSTKLSILKKITYFLAVSVLLTSCASSPQPVDKEASSETSVQPIHIEPQKGRISVENSISRAFKYNQNNLKKQITPKFFGQEAKESAFANLHKLREGQAPNLATSLKELDFATLYASVNYAQHPDKTDTILNQIVAQNITMAAIKAHKNALFANKKTFELRRLVRQYQKQIEAILKKKNT